MGLPSPEGKESQEQQVPPVPLSLLFLSVSMLQRHSAGGIPGWPCTLAGRVLRLQPLSVLWLLPGCPSVHPSVPAAAAAHPPPGAPHWLSVDRGGPALPEGPWTPVTSTEAASRRLDRKSHFCLRVSCMLRRFCLSLSFLLQNPSDCKPCRLEVLPF